ncbi:MAG: lysylphosphatidylglycerol synthase transmembrane domain-containing protein [Terracidiphilus sp.]
MKKSQWILGLVVLLALTALALWARSRIHFNFHVFGSQVALADWRKIAIAAACIYVAYVFRAARWSLLMRHNKKVPLFSLLGTQVIGFTAVALIGRVADPVRPYLVAKKTGESLSTQVAVYIVERLFDFGSMALIASLALLWIPQPALAAATGQSGFFSHLFAPLISRFPILSFIFARFGALLVTLAGVLLLVAVRLSGGTVAGFLEASFGLVSKRLGRSIGHKIRAFHAGLDVMRGFSDFAVSTSLSLGMWVLIALSYVETVHAFTASPALAGMSLAKCILLLMISGSVSVLQLPVLGWFSQIAFVAAALSSFFGVPPEPATACSATLLLATFLCVVPVGLIWARFEHVSLHKVTLESEHAEEKLVEEGSGDLLGNHPESASTPDQAAVRGAAK